MRRRSKIASPAECGSGSQPQSRATELWGMGTVNTMCRKQIDFRKILEQGLGLGAANRRTNPAEPRPNGALWELAVTEFSVCSTRGRVLQYSGPGETAAGGPGGNLTDWRPQLRPRPGPQTGFRVITPDSD